jgi:hypothetical protein
MAVKATLIEGCNQPSELSLEDDRGPLRASPSDHGDLAASSGVETALPRKSRDLVLRLSEPNSATARSRKR